MFLALAGCNGNDGGTSSGEIAGSSDSGAISQPVASSSVEQELPVGSKVTIYVVLGEIGKYNGQKGQDYPDLYIENAVKLDTKVGDDLPGASAVTCTSSGVTFKGWVKYDGNGALTKYEKAPGYQNTILYANFVG